MHLNAGGRAAAEHRYKNKRREPLQHSRTECSIVSKPCQPLSISTLRLILFFAFLDQRING